MISSSVAQDFRLSDAISIAHAMVAHEAARSSIRVVFIKGLASNLHNLRPPHTPSDVDVYVEPGKWRELEARLIARGWSRRPMSRTDEAFTKHSSSIYHPEWPCDIDLHWTYPGFLGTESSAFDYLWTTSTLVSVAGREVPLAGFAASAVILALHGLRSSENDVRPRKELRQLTEVISKTFTEEDRHHITEAASRLGAIATLGSSLPKIGHPVPVPDAEILDRRYFRWQIRTRTNASAASYIVPEILDAPWREKLPLAMRLLWPTDSDLEIRYSVVAPTPKARHELRIQRLYKGLIRTPQVAFAAAGTLIHTAWRRFKAIINPQGRKAETMNSESRILFVDHEGHPGGGQLAGLRILPNLGFANASVVYAKGGPVADAMAKTHTPVRVLLGESPFSRSDFLHAAIAMRREIIRTKPEAIVVLSTTAAQILALVRPQAPVILRLSEDMDRYKDRGIKSLLYFKCIFPIFKGFLANSSWTADTIPADLEHIPVAVAYPLSGIEPSVDEQGARSTFPLDGSQLKIACFSRITEWKGTDLAIRAVAQLKAARPHLRIQLDVYGGTAPTDLAYADSVRSLAEDLQLDVVFHGHVSESQRAMRATDIVLLPSRLPEPFGQVTAQALANGCVVIASDTGGTLELIKDGANGRLFKTGSSEDLTARLLEVVDSDPTTLLQMQRRAQETSLKFSDEAALHDFRAELLRILATATRTRTERIRRPEHSREARRGPTR